MRVSATAAVLIFLTLAASPGAATVYQVPSGTHPTLQSVAPVLVPGDTVEVQGNATYTGGVIFNNNGTPGSPITIRGVPVSGLRPRLHGGGDVVKLDGDNYVFENFEITGTTTPLTNRGIFCVANNLVVRNCIIHDCPRHGVLGADQFSGNATLEHLEIYNCGSASTYHQIYMATDNLRFPAATVRIQFCYIHNGNGGNNFKSRAARNEIYYNWVEGAFFHELELIGADLNGQDGSVNAATVREDSDVVGNVLVKSAGSSGALARIGGDGTGDSNGRFRFVNNTMLMGGSGSSAVRIFDHVQGLEFYNNVLWRPDGGAFTVVRTVEQQGTSGHSGDSNWISSNAIGTPVAWTNTVTGTNPAFVNGAALDLTPASSSPLRDTALLPTASPSGLPFPSPLAAPIMHPPQRAFVPPGTQQPRPIYQGVDVGAIEYAQPATAVTDWAIYN